MLMLVMRQLLQLFFGWRRRLVSYLLIASGTRAKRIYAALKASSSPGRRLGFLWLALIFAHFGTLDYAAVFGQAAPVSANITLLCILLFVAYGQERAVPAARLAAGLGWKARAPIRPDPCATMVTAGIFMVARMSPLYEQSQTARSCAWIIGRSPLSMALVALTQYDIKRVIAYSTLSQLGYMTAALALGYSAGSPPDDPRLLQACCSSRGLGDHPPAHEQDMRRHGRLKS